MRGEELYRPQLIAFEIVELDEGLQEDAEQLGCGAWPSHRVTNGSGDSDPADIVLKGHSCHPPYADLNCTSWFCRWCSKHHSLQAFTTAPEASPRFRQGNPDFVAQNKKWICPGGWLVPSRSASECFAICHKRVSNVVSKLQSDRNAEQSSRRPLAIPKWQSCNKVPVVFDTKVRHCSADTLFAKDLGNDHITCHLVWRADTWRLCCPEARFWAHETSEGVDFVKLRGQETAILVAMMVQAPEMWPLRFTKLKRTERQRKWGEPEEVEMTGCYCRETSTWIVRVCKMVSGDPPVNPKTLFEATDATTPQLSFALLTFWQGLVVGLSNRFGARFIGGIVRCRIKLVVSAETSSTWTQSNFFISSSAWLVAGIWEVGVSLIMFVAIWSLFQT